MEFIIYHCCTKKGHNTTNCWYSEVCLFCGKEGHIHASCREKKDTFHKIACFQRRNDKKASPNQEQIQRHLEKIRMSSSPYNRSKNVIHHCQLIVHWESKCWLLAIFYILCMVILHVLYHFHSYPHAFFAYT
jgi:hypothetical protein